MGISKPFHRTCRQFIDGDYTSSGRWQYLLDKRFAQAPRQYVRAFLLLQQDMMELFSYVEPADVNAETYSHRIHQLLTRTCIEVEANFAAILIENGYMKNVHDLNMRDYRCIEQSHRLSAFRVRIPEWVGARDTRQPFAVWQDGNRKLPWYDAYNKAKHNRHESLSLANLEHLTDAMCGLVAVLSAQFHTESFSPSSKVLELSIPTYDSGDGMLPAIGGFFRVMFPTDWPTDDRYDFDWAQLADEEYPFAEFPYPAPDRNALRSTKLHTNRRRPFEA